MQSKNKNGYTIRGNKIYVQGSIEGEFKRYSTGLKSDRLNIAWIKKNAQKELERIHATKSQKKNQVISNFIDFAYNSIEIKKSQIKENTYKEYIQMFENKIKPYFEKYNLQDIKRLDLQNWQSRLANSGISGKTVNNYRSLFNTILEDARLNELIEKNYFDLIPKEKIEAPEIKPFSLDEIQQILSNAIGWEKQFFQIAFFTGLRTGELLALKWEDINFFSKKINIKKAIRKGIYGSPKNKYSVRTIEMLPIVEDALNELKIKSYMKNSFIFMNDDNTHFYDASHIREGEWARVLKRAKLDYRTLYQTRHTFASLMISKGEDILWVSKTLGHSTIQTTLTKYAKFIEGDETKRASFLDSVSFNEKNCTQTAQSENLKTGKVC